MTSSPSTVPKVAITDRLNERAATVERFIRTLLDSAWSEDSVSVVRAKGDAMLFREAANKIARLEAALATPPAQDDSDAANFSRSMAAEREHMKDVVETAEVVTVPKAAAGEEGRVEMDSIYTKRHISHEEAREVADRLIASHFRKSDRENARISIPANPERDDDLLIGAFIRQQASRSTTIRADTVEACAKAICPLCRDGVELVPLGERHYGGWHQISELGGASDGGTDYEECKAERIRALSTATPAAQRGEERND